jgi:hypothetical protein
MTAARFQTRDETGHDDAKEFADGHPLRLLSQRCNTTRLSLAGLRKGRLNLIGEDHDQSE